MSNERMRYYEGYGSPSSGGFGSGGSGWGELKLKAAILITITLVVFGVTMLWVTYFVMYLCMKCESVGILIFTLLVFYGIYFWLFFNGYVDKFRDAFTNFETFLMTLGVIALPFVIELLSTNPQRN